MAVITDLTFSQINETYTEGGPLFIIGTDLDGNTALLLNVSVLNDIELDTENVGNPGVVKLIVKLRELCSKAQITANEFQAVNEKLDTFPLAQSSGQVVDGKLMHTGMIKFKVDIGSATIIEGATN